MNKAELLIELKKYQDYLFKTYEEDSTFGEMFCDYDLIEGYVNCMGVENRINEYMRLTEVGD